MNLQEIEKVTDPSVLYSLLMPWELGKSVAALNFCSLFLTSAVPGYCSPLVDRHRIDVRQVIWLGTSNIGHELIFEFCRSLPGTNVTREEYRELAQLLRPIVSQGLGVCKVPFRIPDEWLTLWSQASLSSRVTTVLPFVPFTKAELMAIATEVFCSLVGERASSISDVVGHISRKAIEYYIPEEGARSLHRAVSSLLTEVDGLIEQSSTGT